KDLGVAERLFVIGALQRESLQFPRRRGQHNRSIIEALVGQVELVSLDQLTEPVGVHHRDGYGILAYGHSRKGVRGDEVGGAKIIFAVRGLWIKVQKRSAVDLDQTRFEARRRVIYVQ